MRSVTFSMMLFGLIPALAVAACSSDTSAPDEGDEPGKAEDDGKVVEGKAEAWNSTNNPARFQLNFNYKYEDLKQYNEGRAEQTPWPSDYWSYYEDSINVRYHGSNELSPAEKYDKAFNNWEPNMSVSPVDLSADCGMDDTLEDKHDAYYDQLGPAATWQHKNKGNWRARNGKDDDGDGKIDECRGDDYDGIETWWGLCHAWVPAAILTPEPLRPVTMNGVEFTVSDIKALLIAQHDRTSALMLGGRCNEKGVELHPETGIVIKDECRDTNPGAIYVVATNMLGRDKRAFAEDRTIDYQVWNQPVLGYQINEDTELTEEQALQKLGKTLQDGRYADLYSSPKAVAWRFIRMDMDYITESSNTTEGALTPSISSYTRTDHYQMIIELDENGLVVGGEWVGTSIKNHPDFLWLPTQGLGGNPSINTSNVKHLLELSRKTDDPAPSGDVTEFGGEVNVAIPDNNPTGVTHTLTVDEDVEIGALKVKLGIDHTYIGDLRVVLSKDGTEVVLHDRTGGGSDNINETYTVREFDGMSAKGVWTVKISDHANADKGALKSFVLSVASTGGDSAERTYSSTTGGAIPDNDQTGLTSVIPITDEGTIKALKVTVDISHSYVGDLTVLVERGGSRQVLHSREGGSADDIKKTFTLTSFNGSPIKGDWTLTIKDQAAQDKGTLNSWSLVAEL